MSGAASEKWPPPGSPAGRLERLQGEHSASATTGKGRAVYVVRLRPERGVDGVRALRSLLKAALRRHGLRCLSAREADDG